MSTKIAFLVGSLSNGGAERVISNLTIGLKNGFDKKIILYGDKDKIDYPYEGQILDLQTVTHDTFIKKLRAFIYWVKNLRNLKKKLNIDVTLSFLEYPNLINLLSKTNGKTIISVRNNMSQKYSCSKGLFWKYTIKYLYKKADLIIAISEGIKEDLIANFKLPENKIKVIYNPCNINYIETSSMDVVESEFDKIFLENQVIITSGRLTDQKGQWHLIRAFSEAKKKVNSLKLMVLGQGELEGYLKQLVKELDIENDVFFLGFKTNPFKYIARAQLFVFPSLYEGFGNVLVEAMACGIPVISADCVSGPREIIAPDEINNEKISYELENNRFGVLLPEFDGVRYSAKDKLSSEEEMLADVLINLITNTQQMNYYREMSLKRSSDFSLESMIKDWDTTLKF